MPDVRLTFDQGTLLLRGVERPFIDHLEETDRWAYDSRSDGWRTDAIGYRSIASDLTRCLAANWLDEVTLWHDVKFSQRDLHTPRKDQDEAIESWMATRSGVIVMPTGTGKTVVALHAMLRCQCSTLVVSPVRDLMYQWHDRILQATGGERRNHSLWILGHWAYSEANIISHIIQGNENPLIGWKEIFGMGGDPSTEASDYPSWDEVAQKLDEVREHTLEVLAGLSEEDLELPSKNCPPGREAFFGTIGKCFLVATLHPVMHRGQVATRVGRWGVHRWWLKRKIVTLPVLRAGRGGWRRGRSG